MTRSVSLVVATKQQNDRRAAHREAAGDPRASAGAVGATTDRPDRKGKVQVGGYYDPAVRQSIRLIQAKHPELSQADIVAQGLNLVFAHYGVPEAAKVAAPEPARKQRGKRA